jgi:hypothetical protein
MSLASCSSMFRSAADLRTIVVDGAPSVAESIRESVLSESDPRPMAARAAPAASFRLSSG